MFFTKRLTLVIPWGIGLLLVIVALGLIAWFWLVPSDRPVVVFIGSVIAAFGVILNAINGIYSREAEEKHLELTLNTQREHLERTLDVQQQQASDARSDSKRKEAFEYMRRWNDPVSLEKYSQAVVFLADKSLSYVEKRKKLEQDLALRYAVFGLFNFFEEMELSMQNGMAEESICVDFFKGIVIKLSEISQELIADLVKQKGERTLKNFRNLAARWQRT